MTSAEPQKNITPAQAASVLRAGGLAAFPTETVYGLGADAANAGAVRELFRLKGRPATHPVIVHLGSAELLETWATNVPHAAFSLAERFWPGPLTLVLRRRAEVPDVVTGGQETVGLRVPGHPVALSLLQAFGGGIAAPSANRFGRVSPTTAAHVRAEFGNAVPVLDGGPCGVGLESTILDLSGKVPRLLRPGAVSKGELEKALGVPVAARDPRAPRASGGLERHYAPRTETRLVPDASGAGEHDAVLSPRAKPDGVNAAHWLTLPDHPTAYGRGLYAALRDLDALGCSHLYIETVPETPAWAAVRDRLRRAAAPAEVGLRYG